MLRATCHLEIREVTCHLEVNLNYYSINIIIVVQSPLSNYIAKPNIAETKLDLSIYANTTSLPIVDAQWQN